MGEPPAPPNPTLLKLAEHKAQEPDGPRLWTKQVMRDLNILKSNEKLDETSVDYLMPRIFDRQMIAQTKRVPPPKDYVGFPNKPDGTPDPYQYNQVSPGPLKVLSSGIQGLLVKEGYEKVTSFDLRGLWNVNKIVKENGDQYGDKYLRDVCAQVLGALGDGYYLVRNNARGDEFSVYAQGGRSIDSKTLFNTISQAVAENVVVIDNEFFIEGLPKKGAISQKTTPDVPPQKTMDHYRIKQVQDYLQKIHPEIADLSRDSVALTGLIGDLVVDPVLGYEFSLMLKDLRLFYDVDDYFDTLKLESTAVGHARTIFRYETTGNKFINDTTHNYEEGNEHIRHCFMSLIRKLQSIGITDLSKVRILRQGGDFLFDIDLREKGMPDRSILQESLQANTSHYQSQRLDYSVPILPAVSSAAVDFSRLLIDGSPAPAGVPIISAVRQKLQKEAFTRKNQAIGDYYRTGGKQEVGDWHYLAYQFNPRSGRGPFYALEYGMTPKDYARLKDLYDYNRDTDSYSLNESKFDQLKEIIYSQNLAK